jgi:ABC-type phosphate transport system permease subunit
VPLGHLGLFYTPSAMVIAQILLVTPLIAALARQAIEDAWRDCRTELTALGLNRRQAVRTLLPDCRFTLVVAVLAGLGRTLSEVGAIMIVGGNIDGFTGVMTTAIAPRSESAAAIHAPARRSHPGQTHPAGDHRPPRRPSPTATPVDPRWPFKRDADLGSGSRQRDKARD